MHACVSNGTKCSFLINNVEALKWLAKSPDLNPIKDLWGDFARRVNANGRHFTIDERYYQR